MPHTKTAEEIIATNDTQTDVLYIEEWDADIGVRGLTKRQQLDIRTKALVDGVIDEDRSQMFLWLEGVTDPQFTEDQLVPLFEKNAGPIDRVIKRILELSGMKEAAIRQKEARFPSGFGSPVPVQSGAVAPSNGGGVADGAEGTS